MTSLSVNYGCDKSVALRQYVPDYTGRTKLLAGSQAKESSHLFDGLFELFILQLQDLPLSDDFRLAETFKLGFIKLGFLSVHALFHT